MSGREGKGHESTLTSLGALSLLPSFRLPSEECGVDTPIAAPNRDQPVYLEALVLSHGNTASFPASGE